VFTKPVGNRQSRTPFFCGHSKFNRLCGLRRREIVALARHDGAAETEDFSRYLIAWAWHNPLATDPVWSLMDAAKRMGGEISEAEAAEVIDEAVHAHSPPLSADDLGRFLGLRWDKRRHLGIKTIGSMDVDKKERKAIRKVRDKVRQEAKRRRLGMKSHSDSFSRTQPWKDLGISRRTWYRHRRQHGDGARVTRPHDMTAAASLVVGTTLSAAIRKNIADKSVPTIADKSVPRVRHPQWQVYSHAVPLTKEVRAMKDRLEAARGHRHGNGGWRR